MKINSQHFRQTLSPFFEGDIRLFETALSIVENGTISISFMKGSGLSQFTCSGVYIKNPKILAKIKFQWHEQGPGKPFDLQYKCNCPLGLKERACEHAVALFYEFILQESRSLGQSLWDKKIFAGSTENKQDEVDHQQIVRANDFSHGSKPLEYGTYLAGANALLNTRASDRFHNISYQLLNGQTIVYRAPSAWPKNRELHLHVHYEHQQIFPTFSFSADPNEKSTISLMGDQSVFDWANGDHFELPISIKQFLQKHLAHPKEFQFDDLINSWPDSSFTVCGETTTEQPSLKCIIHKSQMDHYLDINLLFIRQEKTNEGTIEEMLLDPPWIWKLFAAEGNLLGRFQSRLELQEFLKKLYFCFQNYLSKLDSNDGPTSFTELEIEEFLEQLPLHTHGNPEQVRRLLGQLLRKEKLFSFDLRSKKLYEWNTSIIIRTWVSLVRHLGITTLLRSTVDEEENSLKFVVPRKQLFSTLSYIFHDFTQLHIPIYYQNQLVRKWNPQLQVTRKKSEINWFEFQVSMTKEDRELLKRMKSESGVIFSDQGLVVLDSEKQSLFDLMKDDLAQQAKLAKDDDGASDLDDENQDTVSLDIKVAKSRIFEVFSLYRMGFKNMLNEHELDVCDQLQNLKGLPQYELTQKWKDTAREYQVEGRNWIRFLYEAKLGACLADDMGLGKTLQTIMFLESLDLKDKIVLIVCPVSLLHNWMMEFQKFSDLRPTLFYGATRTGEIPKEGIILTSYGILRRDYAALFSKQIWDIFIMDEVQHLKNAKSLGATVARQTQSKFRLCLTGTPVENDLFEFTNILDLAVPGIWGQQLGSELAGRGAEGRIHARQMAKPFLLRRTKEQVLKELPAKTEQNIFLSFSEEEDMKYRSKLVAIQDTMGSNDKSKNNILTQLLELRLMCLWQQTPSFVSTKIRFVVDQLEQIISENHSCLIFSQFTTYLDHIGKALDKRSWNYCRLDGSMLPGKRQKEVDRFQKGECPLFLISLKAGGTGLNLTKASYVFIMDPWWNPVVEQQAIDRTHRIGQLNPVTIYRPIIKNSVEERVLELQKSKRELFKDLLGQGEGFDDAFSGRLTHEDFKYLLS